MFKIIFKLKFQILWALSLNFLRFQTVVLVEKKVRSREMDLKIKAYTTLVED